MPLSTDVNLPKSRAPVFPDACVVCGVDAPDHTVKVGTNSIGWWTVLTWWFGKRFSVRVPACRACAVKLQARRWGSHITFAVLVTALIFVIGPYVQSAVPAPMFKWTVLAASLICLSPFIFGEIIFPPPFELTAYSNSVDYEFRDETYAIRFQLLNQQDEQTDEVERRGDQVDA